MSRPARRNLLLAFLLLGGGCLMGGLLSSRVQAESDKAVNPLRNLGRVLALVEDNYVGKVDSDELVGSAIQGMLRRLAVPEAARRALVADLA